MSVAGLTVLSALMIATEKCNKQKQRVSDNPISPRATTRLNQKDHFEIDLLAWPACESAEETVRLINVVIDGPQKQLEIERRDGIIRDAACCLRSRMLRMLRLIVSIMISRQSFKNIMHMRMTLRISEGIRLADRT